MKMFVLLSLAALAIASDFKLKLNENGEKFDEEINIDVAGNTEEIKVPQHQNGIQVDILNDFNAGLRVLKLVKTKVCYISAIDSSEQRPAQMEESMRLAHSKFPEDHYMIQNDRLLQIRKMSSDEVGKKAADYCKGNELIFTIKVTKDNMEKRALNVLKSLASRTKRSVILSTFKQCIPNYYAMLLRYCPPSRIVPRCKFFRTDSDSWSRTVTCKLSERGYVCKGVHRSNILHCCNFICL